MKLPAIHPVRFMAILLLAGTVAFGSYQIIKPSTFTYIKLKEGITVEGGSKLSEEMIEPSTIITGGFPISGTDQPPIEGLIAWSQRGEIAGIPVIRRLTGGVPLLTSDVKQDDEENMDAQLPDSTTGMSIAVDNIVGVTPHLTVGDKVHVYASFEDEQGAHTGLLLRSMPVISLQREMEGENPKLSGVTIALRLEEAVLLTHAIHYGKIHLGKASSMESKPHGIGDLTFANALMKTKKRWSTQEVEE